MSFSAKLRAFALLWVQALVVTCLTGWIDGRLRPADLLQMGSTGLAMVAVLAILGLFGALAHAAIGIAVLVIVGFATLCLMADHHVSGTVYWLVFAGFVLVGLLAAAGRLSAARSD